MSLYAAELTDEQRLLLAKYLRDLAEEVERPEQVVRDARLTVDIIFDVRDTWNIMPVGKEVKVNFLIGRRGV